MKSITAEELVDVYSAQKVQIKTISKKKIKN